MGLARRKPTRRTNWRCRRYALSQKECLRIQRLRSFINEMSSLSSDAFEAAIFLAHLAAADPNLTDGSVALVLISATLIDLYSSVHDSIMQEIVNLVLIEYSLDAGRALAAFSQPCNRLIEDLEEEWARLFTGYGTDDLRTLVRHLRIPDVFVIKPNDTKHRVRAIGETCFIVAMAWLTTGHAVYHLFPFVFGGDPRPWGSLIQAVFDHLYILFYHKISGDSLSWFRPRLALYSRAIGNRLNSQASYVETVHADGTFFGTLSRVLIALDEQRCVGFLDDTAIPTCRPGLSACADGRTTEDIQRSFYSGFTKCHGLKSQTVLFPDGMVGSVYVCSIRHNDNGVFNLSGLGDYLNYVFPTMPNVRGVSVKYALYCDGIFQNHECLFNRPHEFRNDHEEALFRRYNSMRTCIENLFARLKTKFSIYESGKKLRIMNNGAGIVRMVVSSFLLLTCHTCLNGSTTTTAYGLHPPTIDEYLPLDEDLALAPVVDYVLEGR